MQQAVPVGVGAMAALIGVDMQIAAEIAAAAAQGEVCAAANDNAPGQVVISGHATAVERAIAIAAERGFKRSMRLPVSAPFHCALMQPAADAMHEALAAVTIKAPSVPVVANVAASAVTDPEEIRSLLVKQITGSVRWRESVLYMKGQGVAQLVECGSGSVLAGMTKRIDKEITAVSLATPEDIENLFENDRVKRCLISMVKRLWSTGASGGLGSAIAQGVACAGRFGCFVWHARRCFAEGSTRTW